MLKPIDTCRPNPEMSYTKQYQKHVPVSFCYYIKCFDDNIYFQKPDTYTAQNENDDVSKKFVTMLEDDIKSIYQKFVWPKKIFGEREKVDFEFFFLYMLDLSKRVSMQLVMIKLEIIVILLENTEVQHIINVIFDTSNQNYSSGVS